MNTHYFSEGFLLQASLILALGAQNLFVIETGIKKQYHFVVASICSLCDFFLIFLGVLGTSQLFVIFPRIKIIVGSIGVLFLLYYALIKLKESFFPPQFEQKSKQDISLKSTMLTSLAFTLFNPHVYLDTIVLIGGYSSKFDTLQIKLIFALGAASFSTLWFFALAFFASQCKDLMSSKKSMSLFSLFSGIILIYLSYKLGSDIFQWAHH
ncbi:LysE family transporter [bacterium]|nr:LysE family transporter [bacterium]